MLAPRFHRHYDGAISDELCDRIVNTFELDKEGQIRGELKGKNRYSNIKISTDLQIGVRLKDPKAKGLWEGIDGEVFKSVSESWLQYQEDVISVHHALSGDVEDTGYQIQRYEQGKGRFLRHADSGSFETCTRFAAGVIYLNTVEDGGGTRFIDWDDTVAAVKGRILWFPAGYTHAHEGLTPISGPKYIISTFIRYKDPDK